MTRQPTVRQSVASRTIAVVGDIYRFLATGEDTAGRYTQLDAIVPPGGGPPPHIHSREEEAFYILDGEITVQLGAERLVAGPGQFVNIPIGLLHSFRNETPRPARMLITLAPAGLEQMFLAVGRLLEPGATSAPPPSKEEIEKLLELAPQYGVELRPADHG